MNRNQDYVAIFLEHFELCKQKDDRSLIKNSDGPSVDNQRKGNNLVPQLNNTFQPRKNSLDISLVTAHQYWHNACQEGEFLIKSKKNQKSRFATLLKIKDKLLMN